MSTKQLISYFVEVGVEQHEATLSFNTRRYNRLIDVMLTVLRELERREGNQRRSLAELYTHPNPQVRLMAAIHTLAYFPEAARRTLQAIVDRKQYPQAANAAMILDGLDDGSYVPE
jgi:Domain of unknown function (DUF2019)